MKTTIILLTMCCLLALVACSTSELDINDQFSELDSKLTQRSFTIVDAYNYDEDKSYCVRYTISNDTAYIIRDEIGYSSAHSIGKFVNESGIEIVNNTLILGNDNYWFIPFSDDEIYKITIKCWSFRCNCGGPVTTDAGCEKRNEDNIQDCIKSESEACRNACVGFVIFWDCPGGHTNGIHEAAGVLLKADVLIEP